MKPGTAEQQAAADDLPALRSENPEGLRPPVSLIGITVVMKGDLVVGEDLIIEGTFDGSITDASRDTVVVRRTARLRGEVSASKVQVEDGTNLEDTVLSGRISLAEG